MNIGTTDCIESVHEQHSLVIFATGANNLRGIAKLMPAEIVAKVKVFFGCLREFKTKGVIFDFLLHIAKL